jgi:hypothetical protein
MADQSDEDLCGSERELIRKTKPKDRMNLTLDDMKLPRGRLLIIENGVEIEITKR